MTAPCALVYMRSQYGPAIENLGLSLSNIVFVRVQNGSQALWATEQGLRSRGVDVVVCRMEKIAPFAFRRLKMAAEAAGARLLLCRGAYALREATAADIRLVVSPQPSSSWRCRRYRVEFLKIRTGHGKRPFRSNATRKQVLSRWWPNRPIRFRTGDSIFLNPKPMHRFFLLSPTGIKQIR